MAQAKILTDNELLTVLLACESTRWPERNRLMVLLSFKAGLRAQEIARLRRWHIQTPGGDIDTHIHLDKTVIKGGLKSKGASRPRTVPISDELRQTIIDYYRVAPGSYQDPLVRSERADITAVDHGAEIPEPMLSRSIVRLFQQLFRRAGLIGCRSHSGRRTFGTKTARAITRAGGSLKDVQEMLGHSNLATTQRYIEGDEEAKMKVVNLI
ncbi:tyrosine-type recombinase/integrase [Magnetospirillum molischianum]|uniref:Tyr recombinase domain-containing protein n=1 Tax=Magnetospirillum molischianum DSM 120 TaxID=1150626 RepID=H8FY84_MAGML|nr:site-specific integrase [Magnetospirillum molischianum]CCG43322.1 conserved hypothetical protein [Magnetospirillum molischianum DSM 120]